MTRHPAERALNAEPATLGGRPFIVLCLSMFLAYANHWVLVPIIPLYVLELGGSALTAGLVLLTFSVPSFLIRPALGYLADRWSSVGVLALGLVLLAAGTLLFLVPVLAMMFVANIARGLAWGGVNTGGYATLASAAPADRRGEAAGYYTAVTTSASILFPALALWIVAASARFDMVFLVAAFAAVIGIPVARSLAPPKSGSAGATGPRSSASSGLLERGVLLAAGLNLCSSLVLPSVMAFLPLYARSLGIDNVGWFYVLAGLTSIVVRPVLGKKSDAVGRGPAIAFGLVSQLTGLALIYAASDMTLILAGGFFVALGLAMTGSTTTALAMDLADPRSRGRSMGTFSMSFQLGAGAGALISGALADLVGLRGMYAGSIVITLAGLVLLASAWKLLPAPSRAV